MAETAKLEAALEQAVRVRFAFDEALQAVERVVGHEIEGLDGFVDRCALDGGVDVETVEELLKLARQSPGARVAL